MGLFNRRKKARQKETESIDQKQPAAVNRSGSGTGQPPKLTTKKEARQYALDYCGQMIQAVKELQETKKEYKKYGVDLADIEFIENLPEKQRNKLAETAKTLVTLEKSKNEYKNKAQRITDAQFAQMDQLEEEIPDAIKRLEDNEKYQSAVKRDIQYLEGEKGEWSYYLSSLSQEQILFRRLLLGIFCTFVAATVVLMVLYTAFELDVKIPFILMIALVVFLAGGVYLKMHHNVEVLSRSYTNMNRAITLLNSVKMRYVSVTSAVDYACEKYHVHNSKELIFIWEQYLETIREQEKFEKTNDDLEYFSGKFERELMALNLSEPGVWFHQIQALYSAEGMDKIKNKILEQRRRLKERVEEQIKTIQNSKVEIELLLIDKNIYEKEILDILNVIDNITRAK